MKKMCHLRKKSIYLKRETRSIAQTEETLYTFVTSIPEVLQTQIIGTEDRTAPVYVLADSKKLILNCLTKKLLRQSIIDPKYQWTGPLGQITKESQRFVLNDDGSLEIYNIKGSDSGSYICKVNYWYKNEQLTTEIHFMVYVYHVPERSIYMSLKFMAGTCEAKTIASFAKLILEKLKSLIQNLGCEITQWNTWCHAATDTLEKVMHTFTFQFTVFPLAQVSEDICSSFQCQHSTSCVKKAYVTLKEFFEVSKTDHFPSDLFSYIPGTLSGVKVDHCKPGFGKNTSAISSNTTCPGCCVTCPPGKFNAKHGTVCTLCPVGSYNGKYGQVACENCPKAQSSNRKGAVTERKCHKILPMWMAFLISSIATSLILVTIWVIIINCCKKTIAAQYIREAESELKRRLQTFANIASDTEIQEQRSRLSPVKGQKNRGDFLEEESMGLLSNDEITEPTTPGRSQSPDQAGQRDFEINFEDESSPTVGKKNNFMPNDLQHAQQKLIDIFKHKQS